MGDPVSPVKNVDQLMTELREEAQEVVGTDRVLQEAQQVEDSDDD